MSKFLILFNGPPGSGKDAIAEEFMKRYSDTNICKFADPIRNTVFATFPHVNRQNYDERKNLPIGQSTEGEINYPITKLFGTEITLRQWIIRYAEEFMKPQFGKDIFAKITCENINATFLTHKYVLVTDLGSVEEIETIYKNFNENKIIIIVVQVVRKDCNFHNDSRKYITTDQLFNYTSKLNFIKLNNNGSILSACEKIEDFLKKFSPIETPEQISAKIPEEK